MGFFSVLFAKQLYLQHDFDASESAGEHLVPELFFLLLPHEAGIKVSSRDSVCKSCSSWQGSAAPQETELPLLKVHSALW